MAISKIILNGVTQIDLTSDTVQASNLISPNTAHGADGEAIVGTASAASEPNLQAKTNISPTTSSQTITADSGYDGLSSVQINAMPSGTAGTPTATKGTVSNHSISVTPSVTNTTGYITGGTKTGTAVTVTASELASGNKAMVDNGTGIDVVGYSTVSVDVPSSGGVNVKKGTYTPTQTYNSTGNRAIVAVSEIGFTPSRFVLYVKNIDDISTTQYAMIRTTFETYGSTDIVIRNSVRFLDSSGSVGSSVNNTSWTTQTNYYLYLNNGTIYYRTTNTYTLRANVNYIWEAYE